MPLLERLIAPLAPHACLGCAQEGRILCDGCLYSLFVGAPSRCYRCHALTSDSSTCQKCRPRTRLKHVWVRTDYSDLAQALIYKLKFARARAAADAIAAVMGEALPYFSDPVIVTHVPTATRRIRQRGYDHAQLIAKALARQQGLTYSSLLARQGQTRQVGADKKTRSQQLEAAFRPLHGYMSAGAHILLIDDVVTTGASLEAAARVLKQAGAKQIDAAVFAQKL